MNTKPYPFLTACLTLGLLLSACPAPTPISPPPTPSPGVTPSPYVSPSPSVTPSPFVTPTPQPVNLPPLEVIELPDGNLVSDSFQLTFGPGSKGVNLDFGPGTKGPELDFGPGSKGPQNLTFQVAFAPALTDPNLSPFQVQQLMGAGTMLSRLELEIIRSNLVYAKAEVLPRRSEISVPARFHPGSYSIAVVAQTPVGPRQLSWNQLEILPEFNAELRVAMYGDEGVKPEDLDVEVLSRNRIQRVSLPQN